MQQMESLVEYGSRRVIITITAIFCALLEIVDTTIVNVAIKDMSGSLGATISEVGWVITAYAIGNVIIVPMTSWLSQQFGRRNYFAASIVVFTICSFLCGQATGIWELVAFRFLQGLGGGALLVTSQTIITESYPVEKRSMAQAIYGLGVIVGPTLGPPLGGYIVDHMSWPYIFYINIPIGVIACLLTLQFVRSPKYGEKSRGSDIDWLGIIFLAATVGSLQYVLEKGQDDDWFNSSTIVLLSIVAFFGLYFFIWRETVFRRPIVELRVLKNSNLRVGTILSFIMGFGLYGSTFIIPLYTQTILGWTAQDAGMLLVPAALTTAVMMPIIAKILQRGIPQQYLVATGMVMFSIFKTGLDGDTAKIKNLRSAQRFLPDNIYTAIENFENAEPVFETHRLSLRLRMADCGLRSGAAGSRRPRAGRPNRPCSGGTSKPSRREACAESGSFP